MDKVKEIRSKHDLENLTSGEIISVVFDTREEPTYVVCYENRKSEVEFLWGRKNTISKDEKKSFCRAYCFGGTG